MENCESSSKKRRRIRGLYEGATRFTNLSTHGRKESKSKSGWNCSWSTWHEESNDRGSLIYESVTQSTSGESGRTTLCPFVLTVCAHLLNLPKLYSHAHPPKSLQIISKWSHPTTISYYNHCNLQKRIQSILFPLYLIQFDLQYSHIRSIPIDNPTNRGQSNGYKSL